MATAGAASSRLSSKGMGVFLGYGWVVSASPISSATARPMLAEV